MALGADCSVRFHIRMMRFLEDHGTKVDAKGVTAKLTLLIGSDKTEIALGPLVDNGLEAMGRSRCQPAPWRSPRVCPSANRRQARCEGK